MTMMVQPNTLTATRKPRIYGRIYVLLDGSSEAEQAITRAVKLARPNNAEIVLVCTRHLGVRNYIHSQCAALHKKGLTARGHVVADTISQLAKWFVQSGQSDAIVMVQKSAGWLGWLFGPDAAAILKARTEADIIPVGC